MPKARVHCEYTLKIYEIAAKDIHGWMHPVFYLVRVIEKLDTILIN